MTTENNNDHFITLSGMKISREDWYAHADEYLEIHYRESIHVSEYTYPIQQSVERMMK